MSGSAFILQTQQNAKNSKDGSEFMSEEILKDGETLNRVNENISLIQKKDGLMFGTDALLLAAFVRAQKNAVAADFGCGTGIISFLLLAREKCKKVYAIDAQKDFTELAERNAKLNKFDDRMTFLFANVKDLKKNDFPEETDYIVCNPPYMKANDGKQNISDAKNIARHEILGDINDFCAAAKRILKFGGLFYCVYRPDRIVDLICALRENSLEPKRIITVYPDGKTAANMMLVEAKLGGAPGSVDVRPLIVYKDTADVSPRVFTDEMQAVYDNGILY